LITQSDELSAQENYLNWFKKQIRKPNDSEVRNMPCFCGSGIKYKKCCRNKTQEEKAKALAELIIYTQRMFVCL
jgi:uncharacterized protein YchJ